MKFLNRLERKFGDYALPNVTVYLIVLQGLTYFLSMANHEYVNLLVLSHDRLFAGEWWRVLTLLFIPQDMNPLFFIFYLMILFMTGQALEAQWGVFRYNAYLLVGYIATVLVVLIPDAVVSNFFLMESIFLAFAWLYPDFEFLLFFFFPVKVKWLALLAWIMYLVAFLRGNWATKAEVLAGSLNFALFFHSDLLQWIRTSNRKFKGNMARERARDEKPPMHVCAECGITDQTNRTMEFRYCPECTGTPAYCIEHIHNHKHR
jgi:hypothetical protein